MAEKFVTNEKEMQMNRIRIIQKQYKSEGTNFHVGQIRELKKSFVWVYDCGNKKKAEQFNIPIDVIFVSHFHKDHVDGIKTLFDKNPTSQLYVPYLEEDEFFIQLFESNAVRKENWEFFQAVFFLTREREDGFENEFPFIKRYTGRILTFSSNFFETTCNKWMFKPFTYKNFSVSKNLQNIIDQIKQKLSISATADIFKQKWSKVRSVFSTECRKLLKTSCPVGDDSNIQNRTSMCLYSGPYPIGDNSITSGLCLCSNTDNMMLQLDGDTCRSGWLHTGDACLKNEEIYRQFLVSFKEYERFIGTVVLPHHGSENNHNPRLYHDFHAECFVIPYYHKVAEDDYSFMNEKLANTVNGDVITESVFGCTTWTFPRVETVCKCSGKKCLCAIRRHFR